MQTVIIVIHLMIVAGLIGVVLLQKSEGGGLGIGNTGGFLTSRGTANVLTRATAFLAAAFFTTSLILSISSGLPPQPGLNPAAHGRLDSAGVAGHSAAGRRGWRPSRSTAEAGTSARAGSGRAAGAAIAMN